MSFFTVPSKHILAFDEGTKLEIDEGRELGWNDDVLLGFKLGLFDDILLGVELGIDDGSLLGIEFCYTLYASS